MMNNNDSAASAVEQTRLGEMMQTINFFRSVIKSGESWTSECTNAYDRAAEAALTATQAAVSATEPTPDRPTCPKCGQCNIGQSGENPCPECGLPTTWDTTPRKATEPESVEQAANEIARIAEISAFDYRKTEIKEAVTRACNAARSSERAQWEQERKELRAALENCAAQLHWIERVGKDRDVSQAAHELQGLIEVALNPTTGREED